ncbi:hypothetical protein V8C86DRAFT_2964776 [Haematococcus lacustris]
MQSMSRWLPQGPLPSSAKQGAGTSAVLSPLTSVQESLAREAALWQRGVLATPPLVHQLLAAIALLADRLTAVQMTLWASCHLRPRFSHWARDHLLRPLHAELLGIMVQVQCLARTVQELLTHRESGPTHAAAVAKLAHELDTLVKLRTITHSHVTTARLRLHAWVLQQARNGATDALGVRLTTAWPTTFGSNERRLPPQEEGLESRGTSPTMDPSEPIKPIWEQSERVTDVQYKHVDLHGRGKVNCPSQPQLIPGADSTAWSACMYAVSHAVDAVTLVARTVLAVEKRKSVKEQESSWSWIK